jgi:hypothetical protein
MTHTNLPQFVIPTALTSNDRHIQAPVPGLSQGPSHRWYAKRIATVCSGRGQASFPHDQSPSVFAREPSGIQSDHMQILVLGFQFRCGLLAREVNDVCRPLYWCSEDRTDVGLP